VSVPSSSRREYVPRRPQSGCVIPDQTEVGPFGCRVEAAGRAIDFRNDNGSRELAEGALHPPVSVQPIPSGPRSNGSESRANTSFKTQGEPWHGDFDVDISRDPQTGFRPWLEDLELPELARLGDA